jgi:hypothetical protein
MAFAGLNEDTAAKLKEEGVITEPVLDNIVVDEPVVEPVVDTGLPEIDLVTTNEAGKIEEPAPNEDEKPKIPAESNDESTDVDEITKALEAEGFKEQDIFDRVAKEGKVSDALRAELKEKFNAEDVDAYADALQDELAVAQAEKKKNADTDLSETNSAKEAMNKRIYDSVGGEDKFKILAGALKSNLPQNEIDVINAKLRSDNTLLVDEGMKQAVQAYKKLTGRGNNRMSGDASNAGDKGFHFMTKRDFQTIIATDKYKTDRIYAAKVDADRLKSKGMDSQTVMPGTWHNVRDGKRYAV